MYVWRAGFLSHTGIIQKASSATAAIAASALASAAVVYIVPSPMPSCALRYVDGSAFMLMQTSTETLTRVFTQNTNTLLSTSQVIGSSLLSEMRKREGHLC